MFLLILCVEYHSRKAKIQSWSVVVRVAVDLRHVVRDNAVILCSAARKKKPIAAGIGRSFTAAIVQPPFGTAAATQLTNSGTVTSKAQSGRHYNLVHHGESRRDWTNVNKKLKFVVDELLCPEQIPVIQGWKAMKLIRPSPRIMPSYLVD